MKLFPLALLFATFASPAQASPIANEASTPECYTVSPATHFCGCGLENYTANYLVRIDLVNGQKIVTKLQSFALPVDCQTALTNNAHPACR